LAGVVDALRAFTLAAAACKLDAVIFFVKRSLFSVKAYPYKVTPFFFNANRISFVVIVNLFAWSAYTVASCTIVLSHLFNASGASS
jgi:hypothetical protein